MDKSIIKKPICKIDLISISNIDDCIAVEKKLVIFINDTKVLTLYCSPTMIKELVTGIIMTEGIIQGQWCHNEMDIEFQEDIKVNIYTNNNILLKDGIRTSGCLGGIVFEQDVPSQKIDNTIMIHTGKLKELFRKFQNMSEPHRLTGCFHSSVLSDGDKFFCFSEDIGRHNAVDKTLGCAIINQIPFLEKIMLVSGRISSDMMLKCIKWGIQIIISRTSITSLSLDLAEKAGITLIGFSRGDRLNIYSGFQRIKTGK